MSLLYYSFTLFVLTWFVPTSPQRKPPAELLFLAFQLTRAHPGESVEFGHFLKAGKTGPFGYSSSSHEFLHEFHKFYKRFSTLPEHFTP